MAKMTLIGWIYLGLFGVRGVHSGKLYNENIENVYKQRMQCGWTKKKIFLSKKKANLEKVVIYVNVLFIMQIMHSSLL